MDPIIENFIKQTHSIKSPIIRAVDKIGKSLSVESFYLETVATKKDTRSKTLRSSVSSGMISRKMLSQHLESSEMTMTSLMSLWQVKMANRLRLTR